MSHQQHAYITEPQWGEIGRDIRAARDSLERQEKRQTLSIDEIKAQLKAQQSAQDQALNEIGGRIGRPGGTGNDNDLITKDAAGPRHILAPPTYNPQAPYVPSASEINEATIARKVWNGYLRDGDTRRMDPTETKSFVGEARSSTRSRRRQCTMTISTLKRSIPSASLACR